MKELKIVWSTFAPFQRPASFTQGKIHWSWHTYPPKKNRLIGKKKSARHGDAQPLVVRACQMSRSIQGSPIPKMRSPHLLLTTVTILGGGSHSHHHGHNRGTCLLVHLRFRREEQPCGPENRSWRIMGNVANAFFQRPNSKYVRNACHALWKNGKKYYKFWKVWKLMEIVNNM